MSQSKPLLVLISAVVVFVACGPTVAGDSDVDVQARNSALPKMNSQGKPGSADSVRFRTDIVPGYRIVDAAGRSWTGRPIAPSAVQSVGDSTTGGPSKPINAKMLAVADAMIEALSDEEYAKLLLPVRAVFDGRGRAAEYTAELRPSDVQRVREARTKVRAGVTMRSTAPGHYEEWIGAAPVRSARVAPSQEAPFIDPPTTNVVWGVDNRWWTLASQAYTYPYDSSVAFENASGPYSRSSGTLIGWKTALGAAHTFYDPNLPGGGYWTAAKRWTVAQVRSSAGNTGYGWINSCYWVDVPAGYKATPWAAGTHWRWDVAVIDFSICGHNPGLWGSYLNLAYGGDSWYPTAPGELHAYDGALYNPGNPYPCPANDPLPPNPQNGVSYYEPSLLTRAYGSYSLSIRTSPMSYFLQTSADVTPAASGAGQLAKLLISAGDPQLYYVGVWANFGSDGSSCFHGGRKLDATIVSFIQAGSPEY